MAVAYSHISDSQRRTWIIALLFPLVFAILAYVGVLVYCLVMSEPFSEINTLAFYPTIISICASFFWILFTFFRGDRTLLGNANAVQISREDNIELYRLVENLCITRGLPVPTIYVIDDTSLNAFATGRDPQHSSIVVTSGLLEKLSKSELQGVIAHELAHIENRDTTLMIIAIAGISFFTRVGEGLLRWAARSGTSRKSNNKTTFILFIIGLGFMLFGYIIAPILRCAMSRQREYLADATSSLTTSNPGALASALEKIAENSRVEVLEAHPSMTAMCIESPGGASPSFFNRLSGNYASHPPIAERIRRLREMDGQAEGKKVGFQEDTLLNSKRGVTGETPI